MSFYYSTSVKHMREVSLALTTFGQKFRMSFQCCCISQKEESEIS